MPSASTTIVVMAKAIMRTSVAKAIETVFLEASGPEGEHRRWFGLTEDRRIGSGTRAVFLFCSALSRQICHEANLARGELRVAFR
jgi:hypothetical protein